MPKSWEDMSWEERTDQLLREMRHKDSQVAVLQSQVNEMGAAIVALEKKLGIK
jgi:hypothetical protein